MVALLDNQVDKIKKFSHLKVGADFSDPGTGKTLSTLEVVKSTDADALFWLSPFGAINPPEGHKGIKDEVAKWWNSDLPVYFFAPESLSASDRIYLEALNALKKYQRPFIVMDESLKIKNSDAKRTKRIIELGQFATYKFILNGTALSRCVQDLWSQFQFLSPLILNMDEAEFKNTFCEYTTITKRKGYKTYRREFVTKYHNIEYLYSIINPYVFGSKLNLDVSLQNIELKYQLSENHKEQYQELKEKYLDDEMLQWKNNNIFLEMTQHMQHQYCCTDDKFIVLDGFLKTVDRSKVLIYRKFVESETQLKKRYPDIPIFSIQSNSQSLNLQEYSIIVKWDKTWDYGVVDQLPNRVYRLGQKSDCRIVDLTGDVKLDGLMQSNNNKKGELLNYFKKFGAETLMKMI